MYDFTGCECPVCRKLFLDGDDLVVCPDCGTPYHRSCYAQSGHCLNEHRHGAGFEWKPPQLPEKEIACTRCGAMNEVENAYCKSCGSPLSNNAGDAARYGTDSAARPGRSGAPEESFDYQTFYRDMTDNRQFAAIDPNETLEGIPAAEWASFIGRSSYTYLHIFKRMELLNRKVTMSLSAMLFSPFYFFYRKAWKPAIISLIIWLVLETPAVLWALKLSESALTAQLSTATLEVLMQTASVLTMVFRLLCGMFGFYLYKKDSAARIQRIRRQYADPQRRAFELTVQGGISWTAVFLAFGVYVVYSAVFAGLAGPNLAALYAVLGL